MAGKATTIYFDLQTFLRKMLVMSDRLCLHVMIGIYESPFVQKSGSPVDAVTEILSFLITGGQVASTYYIKE